jgi:hypothetical protein
LYHAVGEVGEGRGGVLALPQGEELGAEAHGHRGLGAVGQLQHRPAKTVETVEEGLRGGQGGWRAG